MSNNECTSLTTRALYAAGMAYKTNNGTPTK